MSNTTGSTGAAVIEAFIQETFDFTVESWIIASTISLLSYTLILNINEEIEYIWLRPLSIPTFFYLFTRYAVLVSQGFRLATNFLPASTTIRSCDIVADTQNCLFVLGYIGVQGLLVTRAYSLCRRNKFITVTLVFGFLAGFILNLLGIILFPGCTDSTNGMFSACRVIQDLKFVLEAQVPIKASLIINFLTNIDVLLTDFLVFGVCFYHVWDTWRSQRNAHLQGNGGLVSTLLRQIVSGFFFTLIFTLALLIFEISIDNIFLADSLGLMQQSLSIILLSEFTLELRRCNYSAIRANKISLPTIRSVPNMLEHIHQSIITEMGDFGTTNARGNMIPEVLVPNSLSAAVSD